MRRRSVLLAVLGVVLLTVVGGVAAWAAIPDASGVIHGCYDKSGALRVIDSASTACSRKETALNWNQQGPQGPAGPAGGVSGYEVMTAQGITQATATCSPGKRVLGGGGSIPLFVGGGGPPGVQSALSASYPTNQDSAWTAKGYLDQVPITAYAICAYVQP